MVLIPGDKTQQPTMALLKAWLTFHNISICNCIKQHILPRPNAIEHLYLSSTLVFQLSICTRLISCIAMPSQMLDRSQRFNRGFLRYRVKHTQMTIEEIQNICRQLPAITEDIKWQHDLVFSVGEKMFCVVGLDQSPATASFKVRDDEFEEICNWPGFKPAPYVAKYKWVWIDDISKMKKADWKKYLPQSYELVKNKLSLKLRKQLGLQ